MDRDQLARAALFDFVAQWSDDRAQGKFLPLSDYLARFPEAEGRAAAHDFAPFVLRVERVRWIAGFGSMGWFERAQWV